MQKVYSTKDINYKDQLTILKGTSSFLLMERVGKEIYKIINNRYDKNIKILILCGSGGNGGDGFALGTILKENGYNVNIFKIKDSKREDTIKHENIYLSKCGIILKSLDFNITYDLVIDAIFGVGLFKDIDENLSTLFNNINKYYKNILSIDISSGINSDNGLVMNNALNSSLVVAIEEYKLGHFLNKGKDFYNEIIKINIGLEDFFSDIQGFYEEEDFRNFIKKRESFVNKGSYGKVAIIGGSKEFIGAANISLNALIPLLEGRGYSTLAIPKSLYNMYALNNLENTYICLDDDNDGYLIFNESNYKDLLNYDSIAIGMGLGTSLEVYKVIKYLLLNFKGNLIIDADGLNSLSKYDLNILKVNVCKNIILTPHLKEFSRLIKVDMSILLSNLTSLAKEFAKEYNLILNLKSNTTLISNGKEVILNINGNPSLAKGGSGDLLSGIILGLINKNDDIFKSVCLSNYFLGELSNIALTKYNENVIISSLLIKEISVLLDKFSN